MQTLLSDAVTNKGQKDRLKVTETFLSLQGEGAHMGLPCSFIRLTGCALRCTYCDTAYAFHGGGWQSFDNLFETIERYGAKLIQITGGEPLHQKAVFRFIEQLIAQDYEVLVETGGMEDIAPLHEKTHIVMDIKTPESGELEKMRWQNLEYLKSTDEVKFVVCSLEDLAWSFEKIRELNLDQRFQVLISPIASAENKAVFAQAVIESGLQVRFQLQLHKIIWGNEAGR